MSKNARNFKSKSKPQSLQSWQQSHHSKPVRRSDRHSFAHVGPTISPIEFTHIEDNLTNVLGLDESFISMVLNALKKKFNKEFSVVVAADDGKEVSSIAREEAGQALAHAALNDACAENLVNDKPQNFTRSRFFHSVKSSWWRNFSNLKEEGKSFFTKARSRFTDKTPVRGATVLSLYHSSKNSLTATVDSVAAQAKTPKIKILCNKYKRKFQLAATVSFAALVMACSDNKQPAPLQVLDAQPNNTEVVVDSIPTPIYQVPTDSTRVQSGDLNSTIRFLNNTIKDKDVSGYEFATQRLTDEVMEKYFPDKTRDEVLNAYRYVRSFYPNADKAEELGVSEDLVAAARTAQALDQFLSGCDDKLPENCDALFIEQVKGEYNIRATGVNNPCDDGKVLFTGTRHAKKSTTVKQAATTTVQQTVVEDEPAPAPVVEQVAVVEDSVEVKTPVQTDFEEASSTLQKDTVYTQTVVQNAGTIQKFTSNEDLNAIDTGAATSADVLGLSTDASRVVIENQQTDFVDVDAVSSSSSSGISEFKGNNLSDAQTVREDVPAEEVKNLTPSSTPVSIETPAIDKQQTDFVDVDASYTSTVAETNDSTKSTVSAVQTDFVDVDASYTSTSTATADSLSNTGVTTSTFDVATDNTVAGDSITVKILADSDTISIGTPAAGYVAERGGFENRGLSKEDIDYARKKLGNDTYEQIVAEAPKEWFAKGGIAEGLTPEQFAYITAVLAVTEPHGVPVTAIMKSINCGDTITSEATVKAAVDGVHKNKTRDGWTYSKRVYVERVNNNGCGQRLTLAKWRTRKQKPTTASGPKFPRYFEQRGIIPRQTAFEEAPASLFVEYQTIQDVQKMPTFVTEFNSNEDLGPKKTSAATTEDVLSLETKGTKVMVEDAVSTVQQPKQKQKKKAANRRKQARKEAERAEKEKMALLQHYAQR